MVPIPPLDTTLGAIEIGGVFATFLFGLATSQTLYFYSTFPTERPALKLAVAVVWFLELGHTIATWHAIYLLTITFYGQTRYIEQPPQSLYATILLSSLIACIIQTFFANRIRVLSGRWVFTLICWVLTFARAAFSISVFVITLKAPQVSEFQLKFRWLIEVAFSIFGANDILITGSLCFYLWKLRSHGVKNTRSMVDTLVVWSIETVMITSGCGVVVLILVLTRNDCG
ncbi:hypothetical protein B0H16DRAFT_1585313 [Mycena metata]|uniref:DUF6534 domain-containing protein n=1 Tax=Mycena metata TaxID=1033252 RepID=A0AAD7HY57_9AGAR|nr:hypothetical protein B0H16DRAFT_1585313 [Mycena metata]